MTKWSLCLFFGFFFSVQAMEDTQKHTQKSEPPVLPSAQLQQQQRENITTDLRVFLSLTTNQDDFQKLRSAGNIFYNNHQPEKAERILQSAFNNGSGRLAANHLLGVIYQRNPNKVNQGNALIGNAALFGWPESQFLVGVEQKDLKMLTNAATRREVFDPHTQQNIITYYHLPAVEELSRYYSNHPAIMDDSIFDLALHYTDLMLKLTKRIDVAQALAYLHQKRTIYLHDIAQYHRGMSTKLFDLIQKEEQKRYLAETSSERLEEQSDIDFVSLSPTKKNNKIGSEEKDTPIQKNSTMDKSFKVQSSFVTSPIEMNFEKKISIKAHQNRIIPLVLQLQEFQKVPPANNDKPSSLIPEKSVASVIPALSEKEQSIEKVEQMMVEEKYDQALNCLLLLEKDSNDNPKLQSVVAKFKSLKGPKHTDIQLRVATLILSGESPLFAQRKKTGVRDDLQKLLNSSHCGAGMELAKWYQKHEANSDKFYQTLDQLFKAAQKQQNDEAQRFVITSLESLQKKDLNSGSCKLFKVLYLTSPERAGDYLLQAMVTAYKNNSRSGLEQLMQSIEFLGIKNILMNSDNPCDSVAMVKGFYHYFVEMMNCGKFGLVHMLEAEKYFNFVKNLSPEAKECLSRVWYDLHDEYQKKGEKVSAYQYIQNACGSGNVYAINSLAKKMVDSGKTKEGIYLLLVPAQNGNHEASLLLGKLWNEYTEECEQQCSEMKTQIKDVLVKAFYEADSFVALSELKNMGYPISLPIYESLLDSCKTALSENRPDTHYYVGVSAYLEGKYDAAEKHLKIADEQKHPWAKYYRGKIYFKKEEYRKAVSCFDQFLHNIDRQMTIICEDQSLRIDALHDLSQMMRLEDNPYLDAGYSLVDYYWNLYKKSGSHSSYDLFLNNFLYMTNTFMEKPGLFNAQKMRSWVNDYCLHRGKNDPLFKVAYGSLVYSAWDKEFPFFCENDKPEAYLKRAVSIFESAPLDNFIPEVRKRVANIFAAYAYGCSTKQSSEFLKYCKEALALDPSHNCVLELADHYFEQGGSEHQIGKNVACGVSFLIQHSNTNAFAAKKLFEMYSNGFCTKLGAKIPADPSLAEEYRKLFLSLGGSPSDVENSSMRVTSNPSKKPSQTDQKIENFIACVKTGDYNGAIGICSNTDMQGLEIKSLMDAGWSSMRQDQLQYQSFAFEKFKEVVARMNYDKCPRYFVELSTIVSENLEKYAEKHRKPGFMLLLAEHELKRMRGVVNFCVKQNKDSYENLQFQIETLVSRAKKLLEKVKTLGGDVQMIGYANLMCADIDLQNLEYIANMGAEERRGKVLGIIMKLLLANNNIVADSSPDVKKDFRAVLESLDLLLIMIKIAQGFVAIEKDGNLKTFYLRLKTEVNKKGLVKYEFKCFNDQKSIVQPVLDDL